QPVRGHGAPQGGLCHGRQGRSDGGRLRGVSGGAPRQASQHHRRLDRHGGGVHRGCEANFPNAKITFDKFHVIKLVNEAVDEVRRGEAKHNDWIKGTRYLWLKNLQNLDEEEKASIVRLEAANLDTMQAWQIRQNLQDVFTMPSVASARKYLSRWYAWVSTS